MKNGHDKIDDLFRQRLGSAETELPDAFFEETWEKAQSAKSTPPASWIAGKWWMIITSAILISGAASVMYFTNNTENQGQTIALRNREIAQYNGQQGQAKPLLADSHISYDTPSGNTTAADQTPAPKISANYTQSAKDNKSEQNKVLTEPHENSSVQTPVNQTDHSSSQYESSHTADILSAVSIEIPVLAKINSLFTNLLQVPEFGMVMDYQNPEYRKQKKQWSAELFSSVHWLSSRINAINPEQQVFAASRNDALLPSFSSFNTGLALNLHTGRYLLSAGITYNCFTEHTDYGIFMYNPQQSYHYYYNGSPYTYISNGQYYLTDTNTYWHYTYVVDSMLHVSDSMLIKEINNTLVNAIDSALMTRFDTADYSKLKAKYSVIELPLYAGFEWNFGRWGYGLSAGVIPGMLIRQSGSLFGGEGEVMLPAGVLPVRKFILNAGAKLHVNFYPSEKMMLFAGPEFKGNILNASGKGAGLHQQWMFYGLRGGIRYFF